jgi:hypothetical protein
LNREKITAVSVVVCVAAANTLLFALTRKRAQPSHFGAMEPVKTYPPGSREADRIRRGLAPTPESGRGASRTGVGDPAVQTRAQTMVDELADAFGVRSPIVTFGMTSQYAKYRRNSQTGRVDIRLAEGRPWSEALEYSILHEFAHHLARTSHGYKAKAHGSEFQQKLCRVLNAYGKAFTGPVSEYKTVKACVLRSPAAPLMREGYSKPRYAEDARREAVVQAVAELYKRTKGGLTLPSDAAKPVSIPTSDFRQKKIPRFMKLRRFEYWESGKSQVYPNWTLAYFLERKKKKDPRTGRWMSWINVVLPDGTIHATDKSQIIGAVR